MNYIQIAKDIRAAATKCITDERRLYYGFYTHRSIEIIVCDEDGRFNDEPYYLELRQLSGKQLKIAFEHAAMGNTGFTSYGITGGVDRYATMNDMVNDYEYDPWAGTWDLEYNATTGEQA